VIKFFRTIFYYRNFKREKSESKFMQKNKLGQDVNFLKVISISNKIMRVENDAIKGQ
jgi:hypothetical protein